MNTTTKSPCSRVIKATLYHLNGQSSEITILTPVYSQWSEPCERAAMHLHEYVNELTRFWIQISKFKVAVGSLNTSGAFIEAFSYPEQEIPEGKIYIARKGWLTPDEVRLYEESIRSEFYQVA